LKNTKVWDSVWFKGNSSPCDSQEADIYVLTETSLVTSRENWKKKERGAKMK